MAYSGETRIAWTTARTLSRALVVGSDGAAGGLVVVPVAVCVGGK